MPGARQGRREREAVVKLHDSVELILRRKGSDVFSISPHATVYEALEKLAEHNVGALVVMDGSALVGVLSERDYVRKGILKGRSSKDLAVGQIMSSPAITVHPGTTVDECMQLMTENRCRHLPVVQDGRLAGVVSIGDLVQWIMTAQDRTIHQLEDYIAGNYPG
jgi:CBS domain-containing protein